LILLVRASQAGGPASDGHADRVRRRRRRTRRTPQFELAQNVGLNNTDNQIVADQTFATNATNDRYATEEVANAWHSF